MFDYYCHKCHKAYETKELKTEKYPDTHNIGGGTYPYLMYAERRRNGKHV